MTSSRTPRAASAICLHVADAIVQRAGRVGADRAFRREAHVGDDHVGAGGGHLFGLLGVEYVRRREQFLFARQANQLDFLVVAHPGFFQVRAELAVDQSDGGKILHAGRNRPRRLDRESDR